MCPSGRGWVQCVPHRTAPSLVDKQTGENITLPQTSFASGNKEMASLVDLKLNERSVNALYTLAIKLHFTSVLNDFCLETGKSTFPLAHYVTK